MWAPTSGWIAAAHVLRGINQGLAWANAVIMNTNPVRPKQRGMAMALDECAGYLAVAPAALNNLRAAAPSFGELFARGTC